jgi:hypothetical protein
MHGPTPHHNPLSAAARKALHVAREAKAPWFERVAIVAMIGSAITTTALAVLQAIHTIRRDLKEDRREKEREREQRSEAAAPPERPGHGAAATAAMGDGDDRRWTRREEQAEIGRHHGRARG